MLWDYLLSPDADFNTRDMCHVIEHLTGLDVLFWVLQKASEFIAPILVRFC
jgi:hypothetical protein